MKPADRGTEVKRLKSQVTVLEQLLEAHEQAVIAQARHIEHASIELQTVIQTSPLAIISLDGEGRVRSWNQAATDLFGWSEAEVLGQHLQYVPEDQQAASDALWERVVRGDPIKGVELRRRRKDGTLVDVSFWATQLRDADGAVIGSFGLLADITERKRLEDQLRQAAKMEAVGRLAGGVAHDFNNLLTVITGYSQLLLRGLSSGDPLRRQVEEIQKAGQRAGSLTQQLLAFSRRQILQPKDVNLNVLTTNMASMLHRLIGEDIQLVTRLDPALGWVKADPGQLEQVVMNLAVNARDAMPQGGTLTIETANVKDSRAEATGHSMVRLMVRDTGRGMDAETRARIFEPFFTTKEQGKGTGLGLATVYGIVTQNGGTIEVDSKPEQGTTFTVWLPRVEPAPQAVSETEPTVRPGVAVETILLVEDEPIVRQFVADLLRANGYQVLEAVDGEEACRLCESHEGQIHALLTDIVMPGMNGRQVAERLIKQRPHLRVLFMSGYTDDEVLRHGVEGQGAAFIQKPFEPDTLMRKVRELLEGSSGRRRK